MKENYTISKHVYIWLSDENGSIGFERWEAEIDPVICVGENLVVRAFKPHTAEMDFGVVELGQAYTPNDSVNIKTDQGWFMISVNELDAGLYSRGLESTECSDNELGTNEISMTVRWVLTLAADCNSDAAKINEYAKELNQKYNLELGDETGLQFFDWGFCYIDLVPEDLKSAEEMIKEVVAHFPDMKLIYEESADGPCYQATKKSQNGILVAVKPWCVGVHCEDESFNELLTHIPFIKQQGFDVSCEESEKALYWEYDHMTEEDICNDTIVELSKKIPQATIYSFKRIMMDNYPMIETFCVMKNGEGEWLMDMAFEGLVEYSDGRAKPIWGILKDPEGCFEQLLDKMKRGENTNGASVYLTLNYSDSYKESNTVGRGFEHWLALFKPEDKQWLMDEDCMLYDCIVLAGMHHNWHSEDSNIPLFEYNAEDEQRLFERVSTNWSVYGDIDEKKAYIHLLKFTNLDYKSILNNNLDALKQYVDESDERVQWLLEALAEN